VESRFGLGSRVCGITLIHRSFRVYNFEITDFHTYFVGFKDGGHLVHNSCDPIEPFEVRRYGDFNHPDNSRDGLEGHEVLQNAWLKVKGFVTGGRHVDNPSMGLTGRDTSTNYHATISGSRSMCVSD